PWSSSRRFCKSMKARLMLFMSTVIICTGPMVLLRAMTHLVVKGQMIRPGPVTILEPPAVVKGLQAGLGPVGVAPRHLDRDAPVLGMRPTPEANGPQAVEGLPQFGHRFIDQVRNVLRHQSTS